MKPWIASKNQLKGDSFPSLGTSHKPNLLKPPHHQQNQIKLPSLQESHIFLHNMFTSLIFPHQRFPKKTQPVKPLKQQENAATKNTDPDQLT